MTADDKAVERVARAIFDSHNETYTFGGPAQWDADPDHWRRYARAAIAALAQPAEQVSDDAVERALAAIERGDWDLGDLGVIRAALRAANVLPVSDEAVGRLEQALDEYDGDGLLERYGEMPRRHVTVLAADLRAALTAANVQPLPDDVREALTDALAGWRYIRKHHGDLYGVGWDRVEEKLVAAAALLERYARGSE